ncbi:PepSY domain-containing protein [Oribacterium sp.]
MSKMKQENMEKELQEAVQNLIPNDLFTRITAELDSKEEGAKMEKVLVRRIESKRTSLGLKTVLQLVAACVALVLVVGGIFYYRGNLMVDSLVDLDVNPGIELLTNQKNRVLKGYATNSDGEKVLSGMDLQNVDLQVALNAIVGSMVQQGYMTKDTKGVLVTVQNKDQKKAETLRKLVVEEMEIALSTEDMNAAVFHQVISSQNNNASAFAKENNISLGKAVFVLNLVKKDSSLNAKELVKMKISEIAKLVDDKNIDIRDIIEYDSDDSLWENIADAIEDINEGDDDYIVATTQQGSTQAQVSQRISADKAKAIAFGHAGVSAGQVRELSVEYDDDGVYEIDFKVGNTEYDYEIGATDGSIRKADVEQDD